MPEMQGPVVDEYADWAYLGDTQRAGDPPTTKCADEGGKLVRFYKHNCPKARRAIERMIELGGTEFWTSPDLTHMLMESHNGSYCHAYMHSFKLHCSTDLPPNSVTRYEREYIGTDISVGSFSGGDVYIIRPPQEGGE